MAGNPTQDYQASIMGKKVPDVGRNTANAPKPPAQKGGNQPAAPKPPKQTQIGGNYVPGMGPGLK
jgi:hypothetical protein